MSSTTDSTTKTSPYWYSINAMYHVFVPALALACLPLWITYRKTTPDTIRHYLIWQLESYRLCEILLLVRGSIGFVTHIVGSSAGLSGRAEFTFLRIKKTYEVGLTGLVFRFLNFTRPLEDMEKKIWKKWRRSCLNFSHVFFFFCQILWDPSVAKISTGKYKQLSRRPPRRSYHEAREIGWLNKHAANRLVCPITRVWLSLFYDSNIDTVLLYSL